MTFPLQRYRAFTLIELLVVTSIIALLISILLPALKNARQSSQSMVCQNQQRQIGLAINLFADDNKDELPMISDEDLPADNGGRIWVTGRRGKPSWINRYMGYWKRGRGVVVCPSEIAFYYKSATQLGFGNYGLNTHLFRLNNSGFSAIYAVHHRRYELLKPSNACFLTDIVNVSANPNSSQCYRIGAETSWGEENLDRRHLGAMNILWGDIHIASRKQDVPFDAADTFWTGQ